MKYNFNKLKILIIGPIPPPVHGVSIFTKNIIDKILSDKIRIVYINTSDKRDISHVEIIDLIDLYIVFRYLIKYLFYLIIYRPQLVYFPISQLKTGFLRDSFFILPIYLFKTKIVIHLHGSNIANLFLSSKRIFKLYISFILKRVNLAIVLGNKLKNVFGELISDNKIKVIPNGINFHLKPDFSKNQEIIRIIYLGTLDKRKGVGEVIRAIPFVLDKKEKVKFIFAGEWYKDDFYKEMKEFIKNKNISNKIEFVGNILDNEKEKLLISSDIFVFVPNQKEGQPLVILEAMAAGLPVITCKTGAIEETVIEGETGLFVKPGNSEEIAKNIIYLVENNDERKRMSKNARKRYEENYSNEIFIENMINVFKSVLNNN